MTLRTQGGKLLTKGGILACDCCGPGAWYCDTNYGACTIGGVCSIKCQDECTAAGGVYHGNGSVCCSGVPAASAIPKTITLSFGGTKPKAYGHGCDSYPAGHGPTVDATFDKTAGWVPLDVFGLTAWPATMALARDGTTLNFVLYRWSGGTIAEPSSATVSIQCDHVKSDGRIAWKITSATLEAWSLRACKGSAMDTSITSKLIWGLSVACGGNSVDGFTFNSQTVTSSNSFGLGVADPLRPQPVFCNLDISSWKITGITFG
jgi:hypothetical protein